MALGDNSWSITSFLAFLAFLTFPSFPLRAGLLIFLTSFLDCTVSSLSSSSSMACPLLDHKLIKTTSIFKILNFCIVHAFVIIKKFWIYYYEIKVNAKLKKD